MLMNYTMGSRGSRDYSINKFNHHEFLMFLYGPMLSWFKISFHGSAYSVYKRLWKLIVLYFFTNFKANVVQNHQDVSVYHLF